ncbi:butyrate kinase [Candidatus Fermentibacterales bacterium]|nr:butyrate kinase [Candidatus Fermentibacterales bacterium]
MTRLDGAHMAQTHRLLVINPGSTSTKIAVFEEAESVWSTNIFHSSEDLAPFERIIDQYSFREEVIAGEVQRAGFELGSFSAVVGRGGLVYPIPGGTYLVTERLKRDLLDEVQGSHASNLGALIADRFAEHAGCPAYIVDPVVVDEMEPLARYSGSPVIQRRSIFHALNQKAAARRAAEDLGASYDEINLIVVHLGGGISVGAHCQGKVIDVNNALDGEGPFTPERSGGLPSGDLARLCFSGRYTLDEVKKLIKGRGGIVAYLGTNDMREVEKKVSEGDARWAEVYEAMAYQIAKEIGCLAAVLEGNVDAIVLTGGIAYDRMFVEWIRRRVAFIADVLVYPGEMEMEALARGALRVLAGREEARSYDPATP